MKQYTIKFSLNGLENNFEAQAASDEEALKMFQDAYNKQGVVLDYKITDIPSADADAPKFAAMTIDQLQRLFDNVTASRRELAELHGSLATCLTNKYAEENLPAPQEVIDAI